MDDDKVLRDKHKPVSNQVVLDQERCILCTRCVRFSSEVDGRAELVVNQRGNAGVIDVFENRPIQSAFSGNVVDLCPVGALTAKDYRFSARPWELKKHEALCTGCSVGCNIEIHTKHRHPGITRPDSKDIRPEVVRLMPRENQSVNDWWMCDKGRWGYHFHNDDSKRLTQPMGKRQKGLEPMSLKEIQVQMDQSPDPWSFWISDSVAHEGIVWVKELIASWSARGRAVSSKINSSPWADRFLSSWAKKSASPWFAGTPDWSKVKTLVSPLNGVRELESVVPILALRLGQKIRKGQIQWSSRQGSLQQSGDDLESTAYLVPVPQSEEDLKALDAIDPKAKVLILWTQANSRGLLNEGIVPLEAQRQWLSQNKAKQAVFVVHQTTQNTASGENGISEFIEFAKGASIRFVAASFVSELTQSSDAVLPLTPLYEAPSTITSLENHRQKSAGIKIHHPNTPSIERGASFVSPALRLL
jgi:ferredoxin